MSSDLQGQHEYLNQSVIGDVVFYTPHGAPLLVGQRIPEKAFLCFAWHVVVSVE